jgi:hypothetical protein
VIVKAAPLLGLVTVVVFVPSGFVRRMFARLISRLARLISLAAFFSSFLAWAILPSARSCWAFLRSFLAFFFSSLAWCYSSAGLAMAALTAATPAGVVGIDSTPLVFAGMVAEPAASATGRMIARVSRPVRATVRPAVAVKAAAPLTVHWTEPGGRSQLSGRLSAV